MFIFGTSSERERTVPTNDGKGVVAREEEEKGEGAMKSESK